MEYQVFSEDLKKLISPLLEEGDIELVELNFVRLPGRSILKLLVDRKTGRISLDECARLNAKISSLLDAQDIIKEGYILEVSSPGLDRPLKEKQDFSRCIDKKVRLFFSEPINGKFEVEGIIGRVTDESVYIDTVAGMVEIPLSRIRKAKQIF